MKRYETIKDVYDRAQGYREGVNNYGRLRFMQAVGDRLHGLTLDVGSADYPVPMVGEKNKRISLDISLPLLLSLRSLEPEAYCIQGDAGALPFGDTVFDDLTALELIYYLPDLDRFWEECRRVLKPSGVLHVRYVNERWRWLINSPLARGLLRALTGKPIFPADMLHLRGDKLILRSLSKYFRTVQIQYCVFIPCSFAHNFNRLFEKSFLSCFALYVHIRAFDPSTQHQA